MRTVRSGYCVLSGAGAGAAGTGAGAEAGAGAGWDARPRLSVTQFTPDTRCSLQQAAVMQQSCRTLAIPVNYEVKFYFWGQLPPPGQ